MQLVTSLSAAGAAAIGSLLMAPLLIASTQETPAGDAPTAEEISKAGALYRSSCANCHLPPDPEHATDRAWLNQVTDTA